MFLLHRGSGARVALFCACILTVIAQAIELGEAMSASCSGAAALPSNMADPKLPTSFSLSSDSFSVFAPVVAGSLAVAAVSSAAGLLFLVASRVLSLASQRCFSSLTVKNSTAAFDQLLQFFARHPELFMTSTNVALSQRKDAIRRRVWEADRSSGMKNKFDGVPAVGQHVLRYKGRLFWMTRFETGNPSTVGWERSSFQPENLVLSVTGSSKAPLYELLDDAREMAKQLENDGMTKVYTATDWGVWIPAVLKARRPFSSVILDGTAAHDILSDVQNFLKSADWYQNRGVPYRRGYLLHGPPGTGKVCGTFPARASASHL